MGQAESQWREAVRLRPDLMEAQQVLAMLAIRKGDVPLLGQAAEQMIHAQSSLPTGYLYRSAALMARGDQSRAEADLKKAIELAPQSPLGYSQLASLRAQQKRFAESEKLYDQALQHDPNFIEALSGMAATYVKEGKIDKALARVDAEIAKNPNSSPLYLLEAKLRIANKQKDHAETALQKAVQLDKNNLDAFLLLGWVQSARGSTDEAIASYERLIQTQPRDVRGYVQLAYLEDRRGNWQKSEDLLQRALQIQPDQPVAANNLAYLLLEHDGDLDVALSLAQTARRGLPTSPNTADTLAQAYYRKGVYGLAIGLLEEAVKKVPDNPNYRYHLGLAYQRSNESTKARVQLERALQLNPKGDHAEEIRKALAELGGD